ncbi:carboxypeptidase Y precursor [Trichoderma evansii]
MRLRLFILSLSAYKLALGLQIQKVLGSGFSDPAIPHNSDRYTHLDSRPKPWDPTGEYLVGLAPDALTEQAEDLKLKPPHRKPDRSWDYAVHGSDVQALQIQDEGGKIHQKIRGKLDNFSLRARKVNPSQLGVDTVKQYSGYLDDNEQDKHLFYWFFESRNDPKTDPVILCTSWNTHASLIFLDQPINVGYSYGKDSVNNTMAAGKDVCALLTLFFHMFPEYAKQDFHISGESYGSHYVPAFASEILAHKERNINLKIFVLPPYGGYPAVLNQSTCQSMDDALPRCQSLIKSCYDSENFCMPATDYWVSALQLPYYLAGLNVYDIRKDCEDSSNSCYPAIGWATKWLNNNGDLDTLGVEVDGYDSCNSNLIEKFMMTGDWMRPFSHLIPTVLEQIPVLIYAGDADFICNWLGNLAWTNELKWPGQKLYNAADVFPLVIGSSHESREYGQVKSAMNLTFMRINEAGHMTPMDQPDKSLDFLTRWLGGEWVTQS